MSIEALGQLAATPDSQFRHFQAALERFEADPSFENADLFCFNAEFAFAALPMSHLTPDPARLTACVSIFLEQVKRGLPLLERLKPTTEEQEERKARFLRICEKQREWSELLQDTGDIDRVEEAMSEYARQKLGL